MALKLPTRDGHYPGNLGILRSALLRAGTAADLLIASDAAQVQMTKPPSAERPKRARRTDRTILAPSRSTVS
jgi:hypothetical protein